MSTGLPSLYQRGLDVFGYRKGYIHEDKSKGSLGASLPPISSVNDLLSIGRDEIATMKTLSDSLKLIKQANSNSKLRHLKPTRSTIPKNIEIFFERANLFNGDDTDIENDEDSNEESQTDFETNINEDEIIAEYFDNEPQLLEEEDLGQFISSSMFEEEVESNQNNISSSSQFNSSSQIDVDTQALDLLQQDSLEDESNIRQIDDAFSFVSSIFCNLSVNSSSTSNSGSVSPSSTSRNQSSRNDSARSTSNDILDNSNHIIVNFRSPRLNTNVHPVINRPNHIQERNYMSIF